MSVCIMELSVIQQIWLCFDHCGVCTERCGCNSFITHVPVCLVNVSLLPRLGSVLKKKNAQGQGQDSRTWLSELIDLTMHRN